MADKPRLAVFDQSMQSACACRAANPGAEARMKKIKTLLEARASDPNRRAHSQTWPCTEGHMNRLLYEDPDYGFVVNAVVHTSGREGGVHDHARAWTAYGVVDGMERLERYRRIDDGKKTDYALIQLDSVSEGNAGKVDLVQPYAIHSEKGGPARSVAVIVRSERLVGKALQGRCDAKTDKYHESERPTQVAFELV